MNTLHSLAASFIEQLNAVRRVSKHSANTQTTNGGLAHTAQSHQHLLPPLPLSPTLVETVAPSKGQTSKFCPKGRTRSPWLLVVAVVSLTGTMGHRFYNQPKLDVGTKAPQTIKAPASASIPDRKTTEEQRKEARTGAVPVLAIDPSADRHIYQEIQKFLARGNELRQLAGPFPFVSIEVLSTAVQSYLRQCQEWEWRAVLAELDDEKIGNTKSSPEQFPAAKQIVNKSVEQAVAELEAYRLVVSQEDFNRLTENISQARKGYFNALEELSKQSVSAPLDEFTTVDTWYYAPSEISSVFPAFRVVHTEAIGFWLPPSYLDPLMQRFPAVLSLLNQLEQLCRGRLFAQAADHYLIVMEKEV